MASYCTYCGKPLKEENNFCIRCGKSIHLQAEEKTPDVIRDLEISAIGIKNLLLSNNDLTFLVGAGCSVDVPSCLPAGRAMMEAIINYTCADSEIDKLLNLKDLRFEQLVEIVRDRIDPELKVIDYYTQCDKPNLQHFFLAQMVKKGNFVMTTNFDFLIEHAMLNSGIQREVIIPVITKNDFSKYNNPSDLFLDGKKTLYKVHGSTKNLITEEITKDSLVATIRAFGSNKEGINVFQVEPFKRELFINISNNRSLITMGYSGSDDFDIVPTLMRLKNIKNLIWINYIHDDDGKEHIYEITTDTNPKNDRINQILVGIKRSNTAEHVYRVDVNTTRLIESVLEENPPLNQESFDLSPNEWLKDNVKQPNSIMKYQIPYIIYESFAEIDNALRCTKKILELSEESDDLDWKGIAYNNLGLNYQHQGKFHEAMNYYLKAVKNFDQIGNMKEKATTLSNIGWIYKLQGKYLEAVKKFSEVLHINETLGNLHGKALIVNDIGGIYDILGNFPEALKRFENSIQIAEQWGDLHQKAISLNNIGRIFQQQGNFPEAMRRYREALQINDKLGEFRQKATVLNNIGLIYDTQGNFPEALKQFKMVLEIHERSKEKRGKATVLNNIGMIYEAQGKNLKALKKYEEALQLAEQMEDLPGQSTIISNIGSVYRKQGNYPRALKLFQKSFQIAENLGEMRSKAMILNKIGMIYNAQGKHLKALKTYEETLQIANQLGDLIGVASILNNIGGIHYAKRNFPKALKAFEEAYKIFTQLGLQNSPSANTVKKNIISLRNKGIK